MGELRKIPNVGRQTEQYLIAMGYDTIESLKGKSADELYEQECAMRGVTVDRCQLYLYRAVEYYVNTTSPDPRKLPWWRWKDDFALPSPCGFRLGRNIARKQKRHRKVSFCGCVADS